MSFSGRPDIITNITPFGAEVASEILPLSSGYLRATNQPHWWNMPVLGWLQLLLPPEPFISAVRKAISE